jgi:hypothetical protein
MFSRRRKVYNDLPLVTVPPAGWSRNDRDINIDLIEDGNHSTDIHARSTLFVSDSPRKRGFAYVWMRRQSRNATGGPCKQD